MNKNKNMKSPPQMVNLWERLELRLRDGDGTATYVTRIEDIDKEMLVVERPVRIAGEIEIKVGRDVKVIFNRDDASYTFDAVVTSIDPERENITTIQAISDIKRMQRRKFVRIDIAGNVTFRTIDISNTDQAELGLEKKGELLNISAGGILLSSPSEMKQDDIVLLNFWLKNSQRLENILGLVKRLEKSGGSGQAPTEFLAGIEFLTRERISELLSSDFADYFPFNVSFFDDALQQAIVHFVYRQQVESRKKTKVGP